jgi:hypothetical protein
VTGYAVTELAFSSQSAETVNQTTEIPKSMIVLAEAQHLKLVSAALTTFPVVMESHPSYFPLLPHSEVAQSWSKYPKVLS